MKCKLCGSEQVVEDPGDNFEVFGPTGDGHEYGCDSCGYVGPESDFVEKSKGDG